MNTYPVIKLLFYHFYDTECFSNTIEAVKLLVVVVVVVIDVVVLHEELHEAAQLTVIEAPKTKTLSEQYPLAAYD